MKKLSFIIILFMLGNSLSAQELFRLHLNEYQEIENKDGSLNSLLKFPKSNTNVVMGGLNDLDGMNNYFNLFGSKLIVDSSDRSADGIQNIVLRREDGRDFFNLFPTLRAKLIPLTNDLNGSDTMLP